MVKGIFFHFPGNEYSWCVILFLDLRELQFRSIFQSVFVLFLWFQDLGPRPLGLRLPGRELCEYLHEKCKQQAQHPQSHCFSRVPLLTRAKESIEVANHDVALPRKSPYWSPLRCIVAETFFPPTNTNNELSMHFGPRVRAELQKRIPRWYGLGLMRLNPTKLSSLPHMATSWWPWRS